MQSFNLKLTVLIVLLKILGRTEGSCVDRRDTKYFHGRFNRVCDNIGSYTSRRDWKPDQIQSRRGPNRIFQVFLHYCF